MTMSVSILRVYSVKMTWSTLMRTSEKTLKRVRQTSSLKTAGKTMIRLFLLKLLTTPLDGSLRELYSIFLVSSSILSVHLFSIQQQDNESETSFY